MPALIMGSVPRSETGSANSFNTLLRSIGTSVSAAIVGAVLSQMTIELGGGFTVPSRPGFVTGRLLGAGAAAVAAVVAATIPARASALAEQNLEHPVEEDADRPEIAAHAR